MSPFPFDAPSDQSLMVDHAEGVTVVTVAEASLREHTSAAVGNRLLEVAHLCRGRMIVRLDLVRDFSTAWINEMLRLSSHCEGLGGRLVISGLRANVYHLLKSTGLSKKLTIVNSEDEARRALGLAAPTVLESFFARMVGHPKVGGPLTGQTAA
jgi:anti-anti-sigma regulatory factor